MSGDNFHFGDKVEVRGGTGNIGVNHGTARHTFAGGDSQQLGAALAEVRGLVRQLSPQLTRDDIGELNEHLTTAENQSAERQTRRGALQAVIGMVATLGDIATPLVQAVGHALAFFDR